MKINNFFSSEHMKADGLFIEEMRNLKQVVALFGVNGSGKSRLLKSLKMEINLKRSEFKAMNQSENFYKGRSDSGELLEPQIEEYNLLKEKKRKWLSDFVYEEGDSPIIIMNDYVNIDSHIDMHDSEYRTDTINIIDNPSYKEVRQHCAKLIKALCKSEIAKEYHKEVKGKIFYVSHHEIINRNIELLLSLKEVVKEIMNKDLDYYVDEHLIPMVTLDKRLLILNDLSSGERELLVYSTYIVLQTQNEIVNKTLSLKDKILILDEPELFLHPNAQIKLIKGLRKLVGENGQIWLATHSLSILSTLDRDEIWLMENGKITSPSIETPNKVLTSLIGENNLDSLENFLSSQYEWASIQFALECLSLPGVVSFKENDIQQNQVNERLLASKKPIKILDFGAGKGRIAQEIIRDSHLASNIYYQPLEINKEMLFKLQELTSQLQQMSSINSEDDREVLDNFEKLNEQQYNSYFDYIFMINVLHEIPLNKWLSLLNTVLKSLNKNGKLIILEDQALPRGEKAHEHGFLIFDIEEFKILFSQNKNPKLHKHSDPKYVDRLTCIEITKEGSTVTEESIVEALKRKKINCKTKIQILREQSNKTPKDGRLNGFLTQLYANVDMALSDKGK
ncbi:MAG TPA: AAA family ATPase [Cytophagaceae bacterium]|jgi:ABC-type cobalamin/Fe3+-siderophores transport system ATPase subunit/phospholipid N-methyltransferase|nr:AAA family ATPase [Cytophagaceae bacterium]